MAHARTIPSDAEKAQVWTAYRAGKPIRVPMMLGTNPRVVLMDRHFNPQGVTFEQAARDPRVHIDIALRHARYTYDVLGQVSDLPAEYPETWEIQLQVYNVYEAAFFGAAVEFTGNQVPATEPILFEDNKRAIFDVDIDHPLDKGYYREVLNFWEKMEQLCRGLTYEGRPVKLIPWLASGTDGPFTVACNLRGSDIFTDLIDDPDYADKLLSFLTDAAIRRRQLFWDYWGDRVAPCNWCADDSCAMLSPQMYRERILPLHRRFYDAGPASAVRSMHLCGNSSHLFGMIRRELNVTAFDTGFPVDHGKIRRELGPEVEIAGGPPVDLLMNGTPDEVYQRTKAILLSGVKEGGRFTLREGNNLPPSTPMSNLAAMYQAALDHGHY